MNKFVLNEKEIIYQINNSFSKVENSEPSSISLFLDRDGVIIEDVGYISNPNDVKLEEGIKVLLNKTRSLGIRVFIVTNQSGISRGYYDWIDFEKVNERMIDLVGHNSSIVAIYANSHINLESRNWRKPNPCMLLNASERFNISMRNSMLIGDRLSDMIAGCSGGVNTLLHVRTGHGRDEFKKILEYCEDEFFIFQQNKSRIYFLKNLLEFPYKILNL